MGECLRSSRLICAGQNAVVSNSGNWSRFVILMLTNHTFVDSSFHTESQSLFELYILNSVKQNDWSCFQPLDVSATQSKFQRLQRKSEVMSSWWSICASVYFHDDFTLHVKQFTNAANCWFLISDGLLSYFVNFLQICVNCIMFAWCQFYCKSVSGSLSSANQSHLQKY